MNCKILGIVGSPRHNSSTEVLVNQALEAARETGDIETDIITLAGKRVLPCIGCYKCVEKKSLCIFKDKDCLGEIYEKWLRADGIIISSPVYHLSITGVLKNVLDRLGEGIWSLRATSAIDSGWFGKVGGVITQGMADFGGQEYTAQYLVNHLLLMNCLVVPAEFLTVPGVVGSFKGNKVYEPGKIAEYDETAVKNARIMGKRVAEITKIMKAGTEQLKEQLPAEYSSYVLTKEGAEKILAIGKNGK